MVIIAMRGCRVWLGVVKSNPGTDTQKEKEEKKEEKWDEIRKLPLSCLRPLYAKSNLGMGWVLVINLFSVGCRLRFRWRGDGRVSSGVQLDESRSFSSLSSASAERAVQVRAVESALGAEFVG